MNLQLEKSAETGIPVYQQLVEQLRDKILSGEAAAGFMLPSVRELGTVLAINPLTISKAYKALGEEGLVVSRQGKGTFVAEAEPQTAKVALEDEIRAAVADLAAKTASLGVAEDLVVELLRIEFVARRDRVEGEALLMEKVAEGAKEAKEREDKEIPSF